MQQAIDKEDYQIPKHGFQSIDLKEFLFYFISDLTHNHINTIQNAKRENLTH